ncbi:MAG: hypothetical protein RR851_13050 [Clostridium sp.]
MVNVRSGKGWLKVMGAKAIYSPNLEVGKYYMLRNCFITKNTEVTCYTFEEVEIID